MFKLMIASPSDVSKERQLVRDAVAEWNAIHSQDREVVLSPVGWESHAVPEMGDRPQAILNRQILRDCDILVAVFWTRLGTPTGTAPSGTVEEIGEHVAAGKPALIYFSDQPVVPASIDQDQFNALMQFKAACKERGLYEEYGSLSEFRELVTRNIAQTVIRMLDVPSDGPAQASTANVSRVPNISGDATELLLAAAATPEGHIMYLKIYGGPRVQVGSREFTEPGNPRSAARWTAALQELQGLGLIEDRGYQGEVFYVTHTGYVAADGLRGD